MIEFIILTISLLVLVKSADILVENASKLAIKLGIPKNIIGLTLVAFGTSFPEFVVNILSSLKGENQIALGNIIGSDLANLSLVLGLAAIAYPLKIQREAIWREIPLATVIILATLFLIMDNTLSFWDGLVLYLFFVLFLTYILEKISTERSEKEIIKEKLSKIILLIILSLLGLYFSGEFLIDSLIAISTKMGISLYALSSILIAVGTSLPELVVNLMASVRKESDIAVGNVLGSNIFNTAFILATSAVINPIQIFSEKVILHFALILIATAILFIGNFTLRKRIIDREEGLLLLLVYIVYLFSLIK